jgi:hypothetical protein
MSVANRETPSPSAASGVRPLPDYAVLASASDRFWAKVEQAGDCWRWSAGLTADGYAAFYLNGAMAYGHRVAYLYLVGVPPTGLVLDHLCRNRWCVNPYHLEPVPNAENIRRGRGGCNREKTHCPRGHSYTPENTRVRPSGWRICRECERARDRLRRGRAA